MPHAHAETRMHAHAHAELRLHYTPSDHAALVVPRWGLLGIKSSQQAHVGLLRFDGIVELVAVTPTEEARARIREKAEVDQVAAILVQCPRVCTAVTRHVVFYVVPPHEVHGTETVFNHGRCDLLATSVNDTHVHRDRPPSIPDMQKMFVCVFVAVLSFLSILLYCSPLKDHGANREPTLPQPQTNTHTFCLTTLSHRRGKGESEGEQAIMDTPGSRNVGSSSMVGHG